MKITIDVPIIPDLILENEGIVIMVDNIIILTYIGEYNWDTKTKCINFSSIVINTTNYNIINNRIMMYA